MRGLTQLAILFAAGSGVLSSNATAAVDPWASVDTLGIVPVITTTIDASPEISFGEPGGTADAPAAAQGGGSGVDDICSSWTPTGPIEAVNAAIAAARAEQMPDVSDPSQVVDVVDGPGALGYAVSNEWFRWEGSYGSIEVSRTCERAGYQTRWAALGPGAAGTVVVRITAADLLPGAHAQVIRALPTPTPRIGPADEDEHGYTYVNNRTFFWVDATDGQWSPVTAAASAAGISVTAVAEPVSLRIDPGDGHEPVTCPGTPVPVTRATYHPDIEGCAYTYIDSSAMAPNGETFPVTVSIVWHVTWSATTGEGGDLGYVSTTSATRDLPVAESQAIVVIQDP